MFSYLQGTLATKLPTQIVVDVGGVGYEVFTPLSTYSVLPETGQPILVLTHVHIREDAHQIFGFLTQDERNLFRLLMTVSGIGPKMALTVLSGLEPSNLKRAIIDENLAVLTGISGIGRKTAERIIVELREKIFVEEKSVARKSPEKNGIAEDLLQDTLLVLVSLGYKKQNAQDAIKKVLASLGSKKLSVEELVRASLQAV